MLKIIKGMLRAPTISPISVGDSPMDKAQRGTTTAYISVMPLESAPVTYALQSAARGGGFSGIELGSFMSKF
jgi:hypothetical protein